MVSTVVVTRPRHVLQGKSLQVLGWQRRRGELQLLVVLPDGSKTWMAADWTDLEPVVAAAEPAVGSLADLQHAVTVVSALLTRLDEEQVQAARHPPCQEDDRAACTVEFDAGPGAGATAESARPAARGRSRGRDRAVGSSGRRRYPEGRGGERR